MKLTQLSQVLAKGDDGKLYFKCRGCNTIHGVNCGESAEGKEFVFNGDIDSPTFSPMLHFGGGGGGALLHPSTHKLLYVNNHICRLYVTKGKIQYSEDSTHWYKGRVIEMQSLDTETQD